METASSMILSKSARFSITSVKYDEMLWSVDDALFFFEVKKVGHNSDQEGSTLLYQGA